MVRTQKFLCALAAGPTIVSSDFIDACIAKNKVPDIDDFLLNDKVNEKRFKLKLNDVIHRAKVNQGKLLRGVAIYCTADIPNGFATYKNIVEANGTALNLYRARGGAKIKPPGEEDDESTPEPVYLLTGISAEEKKLWPRFEQMAREGGMEPRVVLAEWLLDTAMSQRLQWDKKYLAKP
jgi:hypothetical protein